MPKMTLIFNEDVHFSYGLKIDYSALERRLAHTALWSHFGGDPYHKKTLLSKSFGSDYWRGHAVMEAARLRQKNIEDNPYQNKFERFLELTGELPEARSTRLEMKTPLIIISSVTFVG